MRELNLGHRPFAALAREILQGDNSFTFKAQGNSIQPIVRAGDLLTVEPLSGRPLRFGDILFCCSAENRVVVHRLVGRRKLSGRERLLIKGDNVHDGAEEVSFGQVLGHIISVRRGQQQVNQENVSLRLVILLWVKTFPVSSFLYYLPGRVQRKCGGLFKVS